MFNGSGSNPRPGMGVFPAEWLETTFMPAAVRRVTSTRALLDYSLQYGEPAGNETQPGRALPAASPHAQLRQRGHPEC